MRAWCGAVIVALCLGGCISSKHGADWPDDIRMASDVCAMAEGDFEEARRVVHYKVARWRGIDDLSAWLLRLPAQVDFGIALHEVGQHEAAAEELRWALDDLEQHSLWPDTQRIEIRPDTRPVVLTTMLLARLASHDLEAARTDARLLSQLLHELDAEHRDPTYSVARANTSQPIDTPASALAVYLARWIWHLSDSPDPDEIALLERYWPDIAPDALADCAPGACLAERGDGDARIVIEEDGEATAELVIVVRSGMRFMQAPWHPLQRVEVLVDGVAHEAIALQPFGDGTGKSPPSSLTAIDWWLLHLEVPAGDHEVVVQGHAIAPHLRRAENPESTVSTVDSTTVSLSPGGWQLLSVRDRSVHPDMTEARHGPPKPCLTW